MTNLMLSDGFELCDEQQEAANEILDFDSRVLILTGNAGSGKSAVVRALVEHHGGDFRVTATTGRAAMLINGSTVDTLFCFKRDEWTVWSYDYLDRVMGECPRKIIIDEASMIGHNMASLLFRLASDYNKSLILVGDWAQARPVKDEWPLRSKLFNNTPVIKLLQNHRQGEQDYMTALNEIRYGDASDNTSQLFRSRVIEEPPDGDMAVRMFATNSLTSHYNDRRLRQHCKDTGERCAVLYGDVDDQRLQRTKENKPLTSSWADQLLEQASFANEQKVAIGCRVLIVKNGPSHVYVNGDTGFLREVRYEHGNWSKMGDREKDQLLEEGEPPQVLTVELDRGPTVEVEGSVAVLKDAMGRPQFKVTGLPIALGYAVTIHKAQGMSTVQAHLDMSSILKFPEGARHGLAYVGLSRAYTLDGLTINAWEPDALECDREVRNLI